MSRLPSKLELGFYLRTSIFSLALFGLFYAYTNWLGIPGTTNKAVADTAIVLMGLSMILSGLCYFWNRWDKLIIYRKYLGLVGFAFAMAHLVLSAEALEGLLKTETWQKGLMWPAVTGLIALTIFTMMAVISNQHFAHQLGGKMWRFLLRTGYVAIIFVWLHVVLLRLPRWITWFQGGMKTWPSLSLLVSIFMLIVLGMRVALWWSLKRKKASESVTIS